MNVKETNTSLTQKTATHGGLKHAQVLVKDMSAWTLEPALMSAMKKTPGPSVNVRWVAYLIKMA